MAFSWRIINYRFDELFWGKKFRELIIIDQNFIFSSSPQALCHNKSVPPWGMISQHIYWNNIKVKAEFLESYSHTRTNVLKLRIRYGMMLSRKYRKYQTVGQAQWILLKYDDGYVIFLFLIYSKTWLHYIMRTD